MIGDLVRSAKEIRNRTLLEEIDALCSTLERALARPGSSSAVATAPSQERMSATSKTTPRIIINGHFLDEVRTRRHDSNDTGAISYMLLPAEHHHLARTQDAVILCLPAITALQLYYDGILPVDRARAVEIAVGGACLGAFHVSWLRKPADSGAFHEAVLLRFDRAPQAQPVIKPPTTAPEIVPLKLHPKGMWDPAKAYWGEEGEPIEDWAKPIIAKGARPAYEMEQVLPAILVKIIPPEKP